MTDYLLLYKGGDPNFMENTTPEQMKEIMELWGAWFKKLEESGQLRNPGAALGPQRAEVSDNGKVAVDQALAEVKELVGGFTIVAADSLEEAAALAKGSPHLAAGSNVSIDVRPLIQM